MKKKTNFKDSVKKNVEKQKAAQSNYGYLKLTKDVHLFTIDKEGTYSLDFLPYEVSIPNHPDKDGEIAAQNTLWYRMPFKVHKNVGADNEAIICPTTFGMKCPICEYKKKRASEGADKDELKAYNPSKRVLYAVVPLSFGTGKKNKKEINPENAVHVWDASEFLFQDLLNDEIEEDVDNAVFPDLEDGLTLEVRFEEESFMKNKFYKANRIDFVEREPYDESILDEVPALDKLLNVLPYDQIKAKFFEEEPVDTEVIDEGEENEEVEEQETPVIRRRRAEPPVTEKAAEPTRRRRPEPEPEPEEDVDDIDEEEDEVDIPVEQRCAACGGTGKDSRGRTCPICGGTGIKTAPKPQKDKIPEDYRPKTRSVTTPEPAKKETSNKCPHGYRWGVDCDRKKECDDCVKWNECSEVEN